jgi:hypothetical protein
MQKERMSKRLKMLGAAAFAATMAASAQAATVFDLAGEGSSTLRDAFITSMPGSGGAEPVMMIVVGTLLLFSFREHREA